MTYSVRCRWTTRIWWRKKSPPWRVHIRCSTSPPRRGAATCSPPCRRESRCSTSSETLTVLVLVHVLVRVHVFVNSGVSCRRTRLPSRRRFMHAYVYEYLRTLQWRLLQRALRDPVADQLDLFGGEWRSAGGHAQAHGRVGRALDLDHQEAVVGIEGLDAQQAGVAGRDVLRFHIHEIVVGQTFDQHQSTRHAAQVVAERLGAGGVEDRRLDLREQARRTGLGRSRRR